MLCLLLFSAVIVSLVLISRSLGLNFNELVSTVKDHELSKVFFFGDINDERNFFKQFFAGIFITIVMTGLDQDMMQKNLSCKSLKSAKKNIYLYSLAFVPVNLIFLTLGVLLVIFAGKNGLTISGTADNLFPIVATQGGLGNIVAILFILGLIAAAYSSADSALTSLTTSFTVDILDAGDKDEASLKQTRRLVHVGFSILLMVVILLFRVVNNESVIKSLYTVAGYTYGPLLGMFAFGLLTKRDANDRLMPVIAVLSPLVCILLNQFSEFLLWGYKFGFELLIVNGLLCFLGMLIFSKRVSN